MRALRIARGLLELAATVACLVGLMIVLPRDEREPFADACNPRRRRP